MESYNDSCEKEEITMLYHPIYNFRYALFMPTINSTQKKTFYVRMSEFCLLEVSRNGYKCVGKHNENGSCLMRELLMETYDDFSMRNKLILYIMGLLLSRGKGDLRREEIGRDCTRYDNFIFLIRFSIVVFSGLFFLMGILYLVSFIFF